MNVSEQNKSSEAAWVRYQKKTQFLVILICFIIYVILFPQLVISMKEKLSFLSNPQIRAKLFYSSHYAMCGSLLASLILLTFISSEVRWRFGFMAFLLFATCPLAIRFLDSIFRITHGSWTAFWIEVNTLSYGSMLYLSVPISMTLTCFIRRMDLRA